MMPLVRTVENEHNSIADGTSVTSLHPPVSYKRRSGTSSINRTNEAVFGDEHNYYCYEDKDLRMRGVQNDEFTPRIRWCRSYWRTVWHGAKVKKHLAIFFHCGTSLLHSVGTKLGGGLWYPFSCLFNRSC